jgi:hypothetical protein
MCCNIMGLFYCDVVANVHMRISRYRKGFGKGNDVKIASGKFRIFIPL